MHSFKYKHLNRRGSSSQGAAGVARVSVDFLVNGESLLDCMAKAHGGHTDFMGCFVRGFPKENSSKRDQLKNALTPDTEEGRYLLYLCPECGDIGCGAYAAKIRVNGTTTEWYDFAYENGYEPACTLDSVGPFEFDQEEYSATLEAARSDI